MAAQHDPEIDVVFLRGEDLLRKNVNATWCEKCFESFASKKKLREHRDKKHSY